MEIILYILFAILIIIISVIQIYLINELFKEEKENDNN